MSFLSVMFHIYCHVMILQVNSSCVYKIGLTPIGLWSSFRYIESVYFFHVHSCNDFTGCVNIRANTFQAVVQLQGLLNRYIVYIILS